MQGFEQKVDFFVRFLFTFRFVFRTLLLVSRPKYIDWILFHKELTY